MASKDIELVFSDGQKAKVDHSLLSISSTLRLLSEDVTDGLDKIPLPNVSSPVWNLLQPLFEHYIEVHATLKSDVTFCDSNICAFRSISQMQLKQLLNACNFLDAKPVYNILLRLLKTFIGECSVTEIRHKMDIKNTFTEEEYRAAKRNLELLNCSEIIAEDSCNCHLCTPVDSQNTAVTSQRKRRKLSSL